MTRQIAVIGGGISGLAAAHRVRELDRDAEVVLLEAGDRLGGVLETSRREGFLIESAADNFLTTPSAAVDLCRRVGLEQQLIGTDPSRRQALVVYDGQLQPLPAGFLVMAPSQIWPVLTTPLLSLWGKLRLAIEPFIPRRDGEEDESLASFVRRRLGSEVFDRLVQPLVGGIYTADPEKLSLAATMPRFRQMERDHGSLLLAMLRGAGQAGGEQTSGARYGQFASLAGGMATLVQAIAGRLPEETIRLESPVEHLTALADGRWRLSIGGVSPATWDADGVVLAVPARPAATLLGETAPEIADDLKEIESASCAVVSLAYRREQIGHPLEAFGFVVPLIEQRTILSCSFASLKYPGRAPEGTVLLRIFIGGACQPGLLRLPHRSLIELAAREVSDLLQIRGEPLLQQIQRHRRAMPQYHVGHRQRVARVTQHLKSRPTLKIAGNALNGVGVPACIESGEAAAAQLLEALDGLPRGYSREDSSIGAFA